MGAQQSTLRTQTAYELLTHLVNPNATVFLPYHGTYIRLDVPPSVKILLENLGEFDSFNIDPKTEPMRQFEILACYNDIESYLTLHDGNVSGEWLSSFEHFESSLAPKSLDYHERHMTWSAQKMASRRRVIQIDMNSVHGGDQYGILRDISHTQPVTELSLQHHADDLRRALGMLTRLCNIALNYTTVIGGLEVFYNWFRYGQQITPAEIIEKRRKEIMVGRIEPYCPSEIPMNDPEEAEKIEAQWIANAKASAGSNSATSTSTEREEIDWPSIIPNYWELIHRPNPPEEEIVSIEVFNNSLEESNLEVVEEEQEAPKPSSPIGQGHTAPQESPVLPSKEKKELGDEARTNAMGDHEDSRIPSIEEAKALLALALSEERKGLKTYQSTIALCNVLIESYEGMHAEIILRLFPVIKAMM